MINKLFLVSIFLTLKLFVFGQYVMKNEKDSTKSYFPNSIGNQWIYEIHDEIKKTYDTVTVTITGDTTIEEQRYMIWQYDYKNYLNNLYYSVSKDSIIVLDLWDYYTDTVQLYRIPFEFVFQQLWFIQDYTLWNNNWNMVIDVNENVMFGAYISQKVVLIKHRCIRPNDYLEERIWFKPYLGIVRKEVNHTGKGAKNMTWSLIDSKIK